MQRLTYTLTTPTLVSTALTNSLWGQFVVLVKMARKRSEPLILLYPVSP